MAYGKRVRIAHAITDLRRPPSLSNSDQPLPSPLMPPTNALSAIYPQSPKSLTYSYHSRSQSLSHSVSGNRSSLGGPFTPISPETGNGDAASTKGLGIEGLPGSRRLSSSPSESNLGAAASADTEGTVTEKSPQEDERGAFSEVSILSTPMIPIVNGVPRVKLRLLTNGVDYLAVRMIRVRAMARREIPRMANFHPHLPLSFHHQLLMLLVKLDPRNHLSQGHLKEAETD